MKLIATTLAAAAAALTLALPAFADAFRQGDAYSRPNPWLTSGVRPDPFSSRDAFAHVLRPHASTWNSLRPLGSSWSGPTPT